MTVSVMKFIEVKAPGTVYNLICFKFGGEEKFFADKGFKSHNYIAGIVLGPNTSILVDMCFSYGGYATEKAGYSDAGDLSAAWQHILRFFDKLPGRCVLYIKRSDDEEFGWIVDRVEELEKEVIAK